MNHLKTSILALAGLCFAFASNVTAQNPPLPVIPTNTFNVTKYGGVGDGKTLQINYAKGIRFIDSKINVEEGKPLITYSAEVTGLE